MKNPTIYYASIFLVALFITINLINKKEARKTIHLVAESIDELRDSSKGGNGIRDSFQDNTSSPPFNLPPKIKLSQEDQFYLMKVDQFITGSLIQFKSKIIDTLYDASFSIKMQEDEKPKQIPCQAIHCSLINKSPDTIYYIDYTCNFSGADNLIMNRIFYKELVNISCNASYPLKAKIPPFETVDWVVYLEPVSNPEKGNLNKDIKYIFLPLYPSVSNRSLRYSKLPNSFKNNYKILSSS